MRDKCKMGGYQVWNYNTIFLSVFYVLFLEHCHKRPYVIPVGDSGYPLRPWLMTPVLHPATEAEQRYTRAQCKTRSVVERCIGVVKSRFRCIDMSGGVLQYSPERVCKIIGCAFILHNLCLTYRVPLPNIPPDDHDQEEEDGLNHPPCQSGIQVRQDLIQRRFTLQDNGSQKVQLINNYMQQLKIFVNRINCL